MNTELRSARVVELMSVVDFTVGATEKISAVARKFTQRDVNAAPVVDEANVCVGIITSHDLVKYEANRIEMENRLKHGIDFDQARYGEGAPAQEFQFPIDEVRLQMTTSFHTIASDATISEAARLMWQKHLHHLLILNNSGQPIGILSSLDIVAALVGEK